MVITTWAAPGFSLEPVMGVGPLGRPPFPRYGVVFSPVRSVGVVTGFGSVVTGCCAGCGAAGIAAGLFGSAGVDVIGGLL